MLKKFCKIRKIFSLVMCVITSLFLASCNSDEGIVPNSYEREMMKSEIKSEVIKMPKEVDSDNRLNCYIITSDDTPTVITALKNAAGTKVIYYVSRLEGDTWNTEIPKWNDGCAKLKGYSIFNIIEDDRGIFYAILAKSMEEQKLVRLNLDGRVEELNIDAIKKKYKSHMLLNIALETNTKMVLQFNKYSEKSASKINKEGVAALESTLVAVEYDVMEQKACGAEGKMGKCTSRFDEEGIYYTADTEYGIIQGRKIDSKLSDRAIKCGDNVPFACDISIKDGYGYILSNNGIYGGKLTENKWDVILTKDEMKLSEKKTEGLVGSGISSSTNLEMQCQYLIKTSGVDKEFYAMVQKNNNNGEYVWVHYYE